MFTMPFSDVTVTVTWAPVTSGTGSTDLTAERTKALSALKDELSKYTIFSKNYAAIKAAYNDGVKAINARRDPGGHQQRPGQGAEQHEDGCRRRLLRRSHPPAGA